MQFFVSIAAVIAMTSVLLVFQMGQPRIWMSMSRDGLLPPVFQKIHPKFKTPSFSTIVTGLVVGVPILFTDKTFVLDFTSIATLFAFVLVCGGVLLIPRKEKTPGKFHIPYINGQFIFPLLIIGSLILVYVFNQNYFHELFNFTLTPEESTKAVAGLDPQKSGIINDALAVATLAKKTINISTIIFWIVCVLLSILAFIKKYSLIPLLGLGTCLYLLTGMTAKNWAWFGGWLLLGLVVYLLYGYKKSKLAK
jgi:amino acid transporter